LAKSESRTKQIAKDDSEAEDQETERLKFTHRLLAWGVLGFATGGFLVLPTHPVVFRSSDGENPVATEKFRGFPGFCGNSL